jgi:hypothetical protein
MQPGTKSHFSQARFMPSTCHRQTIPARDFRIAHPR